MKRVHIVGPPRSGTTLMLELMITGFQFSMAFNNEMSVLHLPEKIPPGDTICSKNPQDYRLVKHIIDKDSGIWFISMLRDPRDVITSRHNKRPGIYWTNLRQWQDWLNETTPFKQHDRFIEVRYEELVTDPDTVQQQLSEQIPFLQMTHPFSDYHKFAKPSLQSLEAMGSIRAVNNNSVGNWRKHLPRLAGQLQIHGPVTRELIELGYENDDQWLKLLDGITPDTRPGVWPEFLSPEYIRQMQKQHQARLRNYLENRGLL